VLAKSVLKCVKAVQCGTSEALASSSLQGSPEPPSFFMGLSDPWTSLHLWDPSVLLEPCLFL